jgi:hypothetical protein
MKIKVTDVVLGLDAVLEGTSTMVEKGLRRLYSDSLRDIEAGFFYGVLEKVRRMQFVTLTVLEK